MNVLWKFDKLLRTLPPIQTEDFLSGGEMTFGVIVEGAKAATSFYNLVLISLNMVLAPDITILLYNSFLISASHFIID